MKPEHDQLLDTSGLYCPEPVMLLHQKMAQLKDGEILLVVATDPATTRDIPKFCRFLQQQLLETEEGEIFRYWIRKVSSS
ncbi:sulfurtransferase TusA [Marinospirillum sp.]|uniref:sulfurtransferase TusA n=1 Tax=Marinospirillum sp. TaxID=2183934 RepID=UPI003A848D05